MTADLSSLAELRRRLAIVLGMAGSAHDGEALAAARRAEALRARAGLTWADVLGVQPAADPHDLIIWCLDRAECLTAWQHEFLLSLRGFTVVSPKQRAILDRIAAKIEAA
jgi:hypothetical protein